jgi:hypothetical protein
MGYGWRQNEGVTLSVFLGPPSFYYREFSAHSQRQAIYGQNNLSSNPCSREGYTRNKRTANVVTLKRALPTNSRTHRDDLAYCGVRLSKIQKYLSYMFF